MIQVGDLVRIKHSEKHQNKLAIIVGIGYKGTMVALRILDTNKKHNYHISRLEKL